MFHIGQKVIRLQTHIDPQARFAPVYKDQIYTVRGILGNNADYILYLEGIVNQPHPVSGREYGYGAEYFAPYNPPAEYIAVTFSKMPAPCAQ